MNNTYSICYLIRAHNESISPPLSFKPGKIILRSIRIRLREIHILYALISCRAYNSIKSGKGRLLVPLGKYLNS